MNKLHFILNNKPEMIIRGYQFNFDSEDENGYFPQLLSGELLEKAKNAKNGDVVIEQSGFKAYLHDYTLKIEEIRDKFQAQGFASYYCNGCGCFTLVCPECGNNACNGGVNCPTCDVTFKKFEEFQNLIG